MDRLEVRVKTSAELDAWLTNNIPTDQRPHWVYAVCPDRAARDLRVVSELRTKGWHVEIQEWDHESEGDPRQMAYWLVSDITLILGCLERLEENEALAKEKSFQMAFRAAKRSGPRALELFGKLYKSFHS